MKIAGERDNGQRGGESKVRAKVARVCKGGEREREGGGGGGALDMCRLKGRVSCLSHTDVDILFAIVA